MEIANVVILDPEPASHVT